MSIIEGISDPLITATGWTLLHSLWQVAIIAVLWRISMFLARKASANVRFWLSFIALLAIPVLSVVVFFRQYGIYTEAEKIVSLELSGQLLKSGPGSDLYLVSKDYPAILGQFDSLTPYFFWLYIAGIIVFAFYSIMNYSRLYSIRYREISPLAPSWNKRIKALENQVGLKKNIKVFLSKKINIPAVVGFFKPVILLPVAMLSSLNTDQVEAILLHEFYHIKKNDHYLNLFQNLIEIVFFYHPAMWWISSKMRQEREKRVDEFVVSSIPDPLSYARALISLEEKRTVTLQPVVAATQSKIQLLSRIKNIMTMKTRSFNPGQKLASVLIILAAITSVAWYSPAMTVNYGHADSSSSLNYSPGYTDIEYQSLEPQLIASAEVPFTQDPAEKNTSNGAVAQDTVEKEEVIRTHKGTVIHINDLPEEEREELRKALEEMRSNLREVNKELTEKFNSEEFRQQMEETRKQVQLAMQQAREETEYLQSEEFKEELRKAREEFQQAMEESREELQYLNSEEFKMEMKEARKEFSRAMVEALRELEEEGYELQVMEKEEWEALDKEMQQIGIELEENLKSIGPELQKALEDVDFEKIMEDVFQSLEKAFEEMEDIPEKEEK